MSNCYNANIVAMRYDENDITEFCPIHTLKAKDNILNISVLILYSCQEKCSNKFTLSLLNSERVDNKVKVNSKILDEFSFEDIQNTTVSYQKCQNDIPKLCWFRYYLKLNLKNIKIKQKGQYTISLISLSKAEIISEPKKMVTESIASYSFVIE